jgi:hypothetical protein
LINHWASASFKKTSNSVILLENEDMAVFQVEHHAEYPIFHLKNTFAEKQTYNIHFYNIMSLQASLRKK